MRFEAIDNLRIQWDLDYDTIRRATGREQLFAGYSFGRTTLGIGHALLNAVDETTALRPALRHFHYTQEPAVAALPRHRQAERQRVQPGGQRRLRLCAARGAIRRRAGGLQLELLRPYPRLPALRAGHGGLDRAATKPSGSTASRWPTSARVGDIRRTNSVFRDPTLPPAY